MKTYPAKIEHQSILTLPDEIIEQFGLHPGDTVHFKELDGGCIELTFSKKESIEIELPDDQLLTLMKMAHERDITFNQLVEDILRKEMNKIEKKISITELENGDIFDKVMESVELGITYIIYEDSTFSKALAVLVPYDKYNALIV